MPLAPSEPPSSGQGRRAQDPALSPLERSFTHIGPPDRIDEVSPSVIGPYRIESTLGRGGAGTVFLAQDDRTNEEVAIKLLRTSGVPSTQAARLAREFQALSELEHPNVVKVFDTGVHEGSPYLVMEYVDGLNLRSYLSLDWLAPTLSDSFSQVSILDHRGAGGGFDLDALFDEPDTEELVAPTRSSTESALALRDEAPPVLSIEELNRPERVGRLKDAVVQICDALSYIHAHGLVHRDLKPSNILVDPDRRVRLMDFGLAKYLAEDQGITVSGKVVGTYRYMAPEQALGEPLDARADLYALGVILYELMTGQPPYDGSTPAELWQRILDHEPPALQSLNPGVDDQIAYITQRLLRKDPDDRFRTAEEILDLLLSG